MIEHFLSRIFFNQWVVLGLTTLVFLVLAELSYRTGNAVRRRRGDDGDGHSGSVQGAVLGLLGLMLGFSFAMAVGRHESRRELVVEASYGAALFGGDLLLNTWWRKDPGHIAAMPDDRGAALRFTMGF